MSSQDVTPESVPQRRRAGSWALLAILAAVACVYLALSIGRHALGLRPGGARPGAHPAVGQKLAVLKLQPLTGDAEPVTLEELRGKLVLLNFWGTWCGPCIMEFPEIAMLAHRLKNESRFRLLSVSCGTGADDELGNLKPATQAFLKRLDSRLPTYSDRAAATRRAVALTIGDFHFALPTTLLLDGNARVLGVWQGYADGVVGQMQELIDEQLQQTEDK